MIPPFTDTGFLPDGIFEAAWDEFAVRFGETSRRKVLLTGLRSALEALRVAGGTFVYVDGSFTSAEPDPVDWDACWDEDGIDVDLLDPVLLELGSGRIIQKGKYLGEMYPAHSPASAGGRTFIDFFRLTRDGMSKGIIALDVRRLR
jgi:hypothetical protein